MTGGSWSTLAVLALTSAIAPFGLIAFSLVLATERGTRNGIAFILGWIATVMAIDAVVLIVGGAVEVDRGGTPGDVTLGIEIGLGAVLFTMWVRRPRPPPTGPRRTRRARHARSGPHRDRGAHTGQAPAGVATPHRVHGGGRCVRARRRAPAVADHDRRGRGDRADRHRNRRGAARRVALRDRFGRRDHRARGARRGTPGSAAARLDRIRTYVETHRDSVVNWALLIGGLWLVGRGVAGLVR